MIAATSYEDGWLHSDDAASFAAEIGSRCESPIEVHLGTKLLLRSRFDYCVSPQFEWRGWRIDFAILKDGNPVAFVECDGAAYHRTADRVKRDISKDAAARRAGIPMFRFTGSEIYEDATGCASRVWEALS